MSQGAIIGGVVVVMICCSASSAAAVMMGGDDESNVGKVCTPQGTPDPNATYKYGANDACLMTCKTGYKKEDGACVEKTSGTGPSGGSSGADPSPPAPALPSSIEWVQIGGKLKQVDIDGTTVCGVNSSDNIYCKDGLDGANWRQLPGGLKHVSVSNGKLYGVNSNDDIYYA